MTRWAAAPILVLAAAGAVAVILWHPWSDGGFDRASFFAVSAKTSCAAGGLELTISDPHFAAHVGGQVPSDRSHKFLVLDVTAVNNAREERMLDEQAFGLSDRPGREYPPGRLDGSGPVRRPVGPGQSATQPIAFDLPNEAGAAKLVYDDGCTHQEWVVP